MDKDSWLLIFALTIGNLCNVCEVPKIRTSMAITSLFYQLTAAGCQSPLEPFKYHTAS